MTLNASDPYVFSRSNVLHDIMVNYLNIIHDPLWLTMDSHDFPTWPTTDSYSFNWQCLQFETWSLGPTTRCRYAFRQAKWKVNKYESLGVVFHSSCFFVCEALSAKTSLDMHDAKGVFENGLEAWVSGANGLLKSSPGRWHDDGGVAAEGVFRCAPYGKRMSKPSLDPRIRSLKGSLAKAVLLGTS